MNRLAPLFHKEQFAGFGGFEGRREWPAVLKSWPASEFLGHGRYLTPLKSPERNVERFQPRVFHKELSKGFPGSTSQFNTLTRRRKCVYFGLVADKPVPKAKRHYNRRVFGRRTVIRNREEWLVEMRKDELVVRRKRTRRQYRLALSDLLDIAIGKSFWSFGKSENGGGK